MAKASEIRVQIIVNESVEKVWEAYTNPKHIVKWNHASDDWHSPRAENDLRVGGKFMSRMESKNGDEGFDFGGTYTNVVPHKLIAYTMSGPDKRKVQVEFEEVFVSTALTITFDAETENSLEMQRAGWTAILENFKHYAEHLKY